MSPLYIRAARQLLQLPLILGLLIFLPAGTLDYWQAWLFIAVFFVCTTAVTVYLAVNDPKLLERRMTVGPTVEGEGTQKVIMALALVSIIAVVVVPALDRRFGWSSVPAWVVILGDILIVIGFIAMYFVLRVNTYGASTIQVEEGQTVISTGPYALIRHPMYSGALIMVFGVPLALASWWGLLAFGVTLPVLAWRLLDEERFLRKSLSGYQEYTQKVRYRLVPHVW